MSIARVLQKGIIVIPKEIRKKLGLEKGSKVEFRTTEEGVLILPLKENLTEHYCGVVKGKLSIEELEELYARK